MNSVKFTSNLQLGGPLKILLANNISPYSTVQMYRLIWVYTVAYVIRQIFI